MNSETNSNVGSSCSDSVSFPNTRKQTTTNVFEMRSRVFRFQPVKSDILIKQLLEASEDTPTPEKNPKTSHIIPQRGRKNESFASSDDDDDPNENILDRTFTEDNFDFNSKDLVSGVSWLDSPPDRKPLKIITKPVISTPMTSMFNKLSLREQPSAKKESRPNSLDRKDDGKQKTVNDNIFKTPSCKNTRPVPSSSTAQKLQLSERSTIPSTNNKLLSAKKGQLEPVTPKQKLMIQPNKNVDTPRQTSVLEAAIHRDFNTPRPTHSSATKNDHINSNSTKNSDAIVLREKNMNIVGLERQRSKEIIINEEKQLNKQRSNQLKPMPNKHSNINEIKQPMIKQLSHVEERQLPNKQLNSNYVKQTSINDEKQLPIKHSNTNDLKQANSNELKQPLYKPQSEEKPVLNKPCVPSNISTKSQQESTFRQIKVRGKDYIVINKIGEGGSGQVYRCLEQETLQDRAIKVVNLNVDPATVNSYMDEVKMLKDLQGNDRVIRMYDYEQVYNSLFVVMEKGDVDFSIFLRNITSTSEPQIQTHVIVCYWIEMLKCVREIHKKGIIHSDLKPSNFLIVGGRLKLIDFGIASRLTGEMTSVIKNTTVGTFNYISPEALRDYRGSPTDENPQLRISYKSDVWSLGCILYQMVYKRTPFQYFGNIWAKFTAITDRNHKIEYPQIEGVPSYLIDMIKMCLVYDMRSRPTVEDLLNMYYSGNNL